MTNIPILEQRICLFLQEIVAARNLHLHNECDVCCCVSCQLLHSQCSKLWSVNWQLLVE